MNRTVVWMRATLGLFLLLISPLSLADGNIEIVTYEGSVTAVDTQGKAKKTIQPKSTIPAGSILSTGANSRAVVRVGEDGVIVVGKNSQVEIGKTKKDVSFFRQISGVIYYAFNAVKGNRRAIEVRTTTSTIGIRGTRFMVSDQEGRKEIGMRKGLVSVTSPDGEFEIHKQAAVDEFEAFKKEGEIEIAKREREFEDFKAKTKQEFIEFKREFTLGADRMVSFDGNRVDELPLSGETQKAMESFENYADKWINEVHD
jgi:hypothetical protein